MAIWRREIGGSWRLGGVIGALRRMSNAAAAEQYRAGAWALGISTRQPASSQRARRAGDERRAFLMISMTGASRPIIARRGRCSRHARHGA